MILGARVGSHWHTGIAGWNYPTPWHDRKNICDHHTITAQPITIWYMYPFLLRILWSQMFIHFFHVIVKDRHLSICLVSTPIIRNGYVVFFNPMTDSRHNSHSSLMRQPFPIYLRHLIFSIFWISFPHDRFPEVKWLGQGCKHFYGFWYCNSKLFSKRRYKFTKWQQQKEKWEYHFYSILTSTEFYKYKFCRDFFLT